MENFYDIIEIYAEHKGISPGEVRVSWRYGTLSVEELLNAVLEEEGIFGYTQKIIRTVRILGARSRQDRGEDPWKELEE